jgi:hypothetical protein
VLAAAIDLLIRDDTTGFLPAIGKILGAVQDVRRQQKETPQATALLLTDKGINERVVTATTLWRETQHERNERIRKTRRKDDDY